MAKPNRENVISEILVRLAGSIKYTECLADIGGKWRIPSRTFDRYWKEANSRYAVTQLEAQKAIHDATVANRAEEARKGLKSKSEYVKEIQDMLDADEYEESAFDFRTGTVTTYMRRLTPLERRALYERISKFEGMDAPLKLANTDSEGKDKEQVFYVLPDGSKIVI